MVTEAVIVPNLFELIKKGIKTTHILPLFYVRTEVNTHHDRMTLPRILSFDSTFIYKDLVNTHLYIYPYNFFTKEYTLPKHTYPQWYRDILISTHVLITKIYKKIRKPIRVLVVSNEIKKLAEETSDTLMRSGIAVSDILETCKIYPDLTQDNIPTNTIKSIWWSKGYLWDSDYMIKVIRFYKD